MSENPNFTLFENIVATPDPADSYRLERSARVSDTAVRVERDAIATGNAWSQPFKFLPFSSRSRK